MNLRSTATGMVGLALAASMLVGCLADEEVGKVEAALSAPGPWDIPAETVALGDAQWVENTQAGPWVGTSGCSGGIRPGAQVLKEWLDVAFPQIRSIGGYSCRHINGNSSRMSVHATGRALDIMMPLHAGDADNDLGDPIGNYLIEHSEEIGIQYIIWDRWSWNSSRSAGTKERDYGGAHPHHDHLHVELSLQAAAMETPWFSGPMEMPTIEGCDALPADGGTVDNTSTCFGAFGNATYWRDVTDAGEGGSLIWTNAFESDTPSNWARWHLNVEAAGEYAVEVSVDPAWGVFGETRYSIDHDGAEDIVVANQGTSDGWLRLGIYDFAAGAGQHVSVYDNAMTAVPPEQHIVADAVRLVPATPEMDPVMDPGVEPAEPPPATEDPVMPGGDPMIDDDPYYGPGDGRVRGGCNVASAADPGPSALPLLGVCILLLLRRRRR